MTNKSEKLIVSDRVIRLPGAEPAGAVWDILDKFVRDLQHCEHAAEQMDCVLRAVRDAVFADAVFKYSPLPGISLDLVARRAVSPAWCRNFAQRQLHTLPSNRASHCALSITEEVPAEQEARPHSTGMIRLSKSRCLWIVAVSFDPHRLFHANDLKVMALIRRIFLDHRRHCHSHEKLTDAVLGVVRGLNEAISAKSPFTCGHSERVARMAVRLGQQVGLAPALLGDLHLAGLLHDVGKIGIRDSVLQKPGPLTEEENAHMREHPVIGDTIVSKIKPLVHLRSGVRNHHERFDGKGYPDSLVGYAIPLVARILAIVDACDAMMSPRPYRPGLHVADVDAIMSAGAGSQWDPRLINDFMDCRRELYSIYEKGIGDSVLCAVQEVVRETDDD